MSQDFRVFDSDIHLVEPPDLFERYLDRKFAHHTVRSSPVAFECVLPFFRIDDLVMPALIRQLPPGLTPDMLEAMLSNSPQVELVKNKTRAKYREFFEKRWSGSAVLGAMDAEGIQLTVLYPTSALLAMGTNDIDPALADAIARAYNNYVADLCNADPARLFGSAMVSVHDIDNALREAERCVRTLGFKSIFLRPNLVHGRNWYDSYYDPLWKLAQEYDVPIAFHEGIGGHLPHVGDIFGPNIYLHHVACHPLEMMLALMSFCGGGVLERFPKLRVAFLEGNVGWAPWLLDRLDDHYEMSFGVNESTLPHPPSFYFKRQCYLSAECDENLIGTAIERFGDSNMVYSTDFPHPDSKYPRATRTFIEKKDIPEASKRKIMWDNSAVLYGMQRELGLVASSPTRVTAAGEAAAPMAE